MSNKHRPDLFTHTVNNLRTGAAKDLSQELADTIEAVRRTQKVGTVTLVLKIKPEGEGMYSFKEEIKSSQPQLPRGQSIFWGTPDGNLVTSDPAQGNLELKTISTVEEKSTPLKQVNG